MGMEAAKWGGSLRESWGQNFFIMGVINACLNSDGKESMQVIRL